MSPTGATDTQRLLIVAAEAIDSQQVREAIAERAKGRETRVRLVAPAIDQSKLEHTLGDVDEATESARKRLERSAAELERAGLDAADARVGDPDLKQAIEDALGDFPADEILIVAHSDGGPSYERRWIEEAEHEFAPPITEIFVDHDSGEGHVADIERLPAGHADADSGEVEGQSENLPPFSPRDLLGIGIAIIGTIVLVVLAASGSSDLTGLSSQSVRILIAGAFGLINLAHVVGLTLFQAGPYRGGGRELFAKLSLYGTPLAIVVSAVLLLAGDEIRPVLRRRLLAVAALVAVGVAVWLLVRPGGPAGPVDRHGADVVEMEIASDAVGERLPVTAVVPAGAGKGSPLLVFLHGRGGDEDSELEDELFSVLDDLGDRAPIVAFPYGEEASYWHNRADGAWADYVLGEVIPQVGERVSADTERVAIGGISMGGYGAYNLARVAPGRFCAVGGHSPALWQTAGETAAGAFDDADDFAANDVIAAATADPAAFTGQPLWLDAGDEDPFLPGDEAFAQAVEAGGGDVQEHIWPGAHEDEYWDGHLDEYMRFYARSLAHC